MTAEAATRRLLGALTVMAVVAATSMSAPVHAQATAPAAEGDRPGRFAMHPVDGGFVRLDTETGAVSLCSKGPRGFACEAVPDERGQLQEIERLKAANRALEDEVRRLVADAQGRAGSARRLELPTEADVDKALDYMERMFKKFRDRFRDLDRQGGGSRGAPL